MVFQLKFFCFYSFNNNKLIIISIYFVHSKLSKFKYFYAVLFRLCK